MKRGIGAALAVKRRRRLTGFKSGRLSPHHRARNFHFLLKTVSPLPRGALLLIGASPSLFTERPLLSLSLQIRPVLSAEEGGAGGGWDFRGEEVFPVPGFVFQIRTGFRRKGIRPQTLNPSAL